MCFCLFVFKHKYYQMPYRLVVAGAVFQSDSGHVRQAFVGRGLILFWFALTNQKEVKSFEIYLVMNL